MAPERTTGMKRPYIHPSVHEEIVERLRREREDARAQLAALRQAVTTTADRWEAAAEGDRMLAAMVRENGDHQDTAEGHDLSAKLYDHHAVALRKLVTS